MVKLYTKKGDAGMTALASGKPVKKNSDLIELCGELDELNSFLGWTAEALCNKDHACAELVKKILRVQKELFDIGWQLSSGNKYVLEPQKIAHLESEIDAMSEHLPVLKRFILPGGGECSCRFHLTRTICRRVERIAYRVLEKNDSFAFVAEYLNRLSDWLFCAARYIAFLSNIEEITWERQ
jgi:cob(I)alamin adenosyltransferase